MSGAPCLLLVLCYGGSPSVLVAAVGFMLAHSLDLAGPEWGGVCLGVQWATVAGVGLTVALGSHHALVHSFALVLLPASLMAWLGLAGVWATLQHRW